MGADDAAWDGIDLAPLLRLQPLGGDRFRAACNERNLGGEIFGGQYLGQALAAALATGEGRAPNAMSGFFLKAASAAHPLELQVERLRDGRSFAHRRVSLFQQGELVFVADVSLHDAESGQPQHQCPAPSVPAPEALTSLRGLLEQHGESLGALGQGRITNKTTVELRPVDPHAGFTGPGTEPRTQVWLRALRLSSDDPLMHYAALAYLSDFWVNSACRLLHGRTLFAGETRSASLNHAIWFHRPPQAADWLLYVLDSPAASGGCGYNRGLLYDRQGQLLASTAQEALVRRAATS